MQIKIQRCQYPWNLDYPFPYKKNKIINQDTKCAISSLLPPIIKNHDRVFLFKGGGRVQNWTRSKNAGWTSRKCELSHSWLNFGRILAPISTRRVGSGQPGTIPSSPARLPSSPVRFQWLQPATRDRILPRYQSEMLPVGEDPARQFCFNHSLLDFLPPGRGNAKIIERIFGW